MLSYTDKKGKKHRACHTSKKKAQGQIAAIEGPREVDEALLRIYLREKMMLEIASSLEGEDDLLFATQEQKEQIYDIMHHGKIDPTDTVAGQFMDVAVGTDNVEADRLSRVDPGDHDFYFTQDDVDHVLVYLRSNNYKKAADELAKIKFGKYIPPA